MVTNEDIKEEAKERYDDSKLQMAFSLGAVWMKDELQNKPMQQDTPMEVVVYNRDQELRAAGFLMQQGYELRLEGGSVFSGVVYKYPVRVFVNETGEVDSTPIER